MSLKGINYTKTEQKKIIEGFKRNDESIMEDSYLRIYPKVRKYVVNNFGNDAQSKDIFQEAFLRTWQLIKKDHFKKDTNTNIEAYIFTTAKNKWKDYLRSSQYKKTVSNNSVVNIRDTEETKDFELYENEDTENKIDAMQWAFNELGQSCKSIISQFYFEGKSTEAISKISGISVASARNKKYRCIKKLKDLVLNFRKHGK